MARYKISFEYRGCDFFGSQIQNISPTVQGELIKALCTLTKNKVTKVTLAGRTDRGVSAYCQCAHFDYDIILQNETKFLLSLNALLPKSLRVFEIENVVASFHAQKSATYRHYQYKINNNIIASPFDINVYHTRLKLNQDKINSCLGYLIGKHDFSSFKSSSDNPYNDCIIYHAYAKSDGKYILIDIIGNRFLYNMVRAIVGTIFFIESKNLTQDYMKYVLESGFRKNAGPNIDAIGLTLIKTGYDNPYNYINKLNERHI